MCCADPDSVPAALDYDRGGGDGWSYTDCDGLTGGVWKSTEVHWKRAPVADPVGVHVDGPNFRTVEVQDGKGQRIGRVASGPAITFEGVDYTDTPPPLRPIPPEKIAAARKAIEIMKRRQEDIANGYWPFGWEPDDNHRTYPDGCGGVIRLPNTERGRRAAWELEGS